MLRFGLEPSRNADSIHRTQLLRAVRALEGVDMTNAVIVDAIRTPLGRRNGKLKDWHPVDLAAETLNALVDRTGLDPALVDDVVMGCVMQVGEQAANVARNAVLAAGLARARARAPRSTGSAGRVSRRRTSRRRA